VLNPLTSIFELKLSGPITKPSWSVNIGSGDRSPPPAETPPAAKPAAADPVPGKQ
jgi:hypothetical protein